MANIRACKFFSNGSCRYGTACRYSHIGSIIESEAKNKIGFQNTTGKIIPKYNEDNSCFITIGIIEGIHNHRISLSVFNTKKSRLDIFSKKIIACTRVQIYRKGYPEIIIHIDLFTFTKDQTKFYINPDCTGNHIWMSGFMNNEIKNSFVGNNFDEAVRGFYSLYSNNKDFMNKYCLSKIIFDIQDIINIIHNFFIILSRPTFEICGEHATKRFIDYLKIINKAFM